MEKTFRQAFNFVTKDVLHYFPGHMPKGMRQMQRTLKNVDAVIEVHDARIPFSGRNPNFYDTVNLRPHMLVLNKMDLVDMSQSDRITERLKEEGISKVLYTNCKKQTHISVKNKFVPAVMELLESVPRFHRSSSESYSLLVIGVPNVGKSSLINALRRTHLKKGKATRVGAVSGITRSVEERIKVCGSPPVYVFDTPGILPTTVTNVESGMKLASCNILKDHLVGEDLIADYILFFLNKNSRFEYVEYFSLPEPLDDVYKLLTYICKEKEFFNKSTLLSGTGNTLALTPDLIRASKTFMKAFRDGHLGKINMDIDILNSQDV